MSIRHFPQSRTLKLKAACQCMFAALLFANVSGCSQTNSGTEDWALNPGEQKQFDVYFKKGYKVELRVRSETNSDIDMFVYYDRQKIFKDERGNKNCDLNFIAPHSGTYNIVIANRQIEGGRGPSRNISNKGTFTFKQRKN